MNAPMTHDPLVVNTQDGTCWVRRAVSREGRGLYAVADAPACCPEYVMATLAELAEHGLASMADALPMPVGSTAPDAGRVREELFYEELATSARLRLALESAQRGRREARAFRKLTEESRKRWRDALIKDRGELETLRAEVAALRAERHETNEFLDDAVQALRARRGDEPAETVTVRPSEDVTPQVTKLRDLLAGQRAAVEDPHDGPLAHRYRVPRDLPPLGGA